MYNWIKKRSGAYWITLCLTTILCYGFLIINFSIGIDDLIVESYVRGKALIYQNRIGHYLCSLLLNVAVPIPFWAELIGVLSMVISVTMIVDFMEYASCNRLKEKSLIILACITISYPFIAKAAIFSSLTLTIGYIWFGAAMAGKQLLKYLQDKKISNLLSSILFGTFAILFDKAYISLVIVLFLLGYLLCIIFENSQVEIKSIFGHGIITAGIWIIELAFSVVLTKIVQYINNIQAGSYTQSYVLYSKENFVTQITQLFKDGLKYLFSMFSQDYGVALYVVAIFVLLIAVIESCIKDKKQNTILKILLYIAIIVSTNLVHLVTGNINMPRRSFCYLFAIFTGFSLMIGNEIILDKINIKGKSIIINSLIAILIIYSSKSMLNIYMNDYIKYSLDKTKMENIVKDIYKYTSGMDKPVIFIGIPDNYNLEGDIESWSNFVADRSSDDSTELSSTRLNSFFTYHGYEIKGWSGEKIDKREIRERCAKMSVWPQEGSIEEADEYILVKLGDSRCEIINMSCEEFLDLYQNGNSEFVCAIGCMSYDTEQRFFSLDGWILMKEHNDYSSNIKLGLLSKNDNTQYTCYLENLINPGVTAYWSDGYNHDNSQFRIYSSLSDEICSGEYQLVLLINNMYGKYYYDLEKSIVIE